MPTRDDEDELLSSVALQNARSILLTRQRAEDAVQKQSEWLRITLSSIGDAVLSTDAEGRVTFMNGVAEALTGWPQAEAVGRPLPDVFHIINERTRQPVENPVLRALGEGTVVGLANHTVLIARDGTERPIDDSAAPMRGETGAAIGAVLVFRDVTERKRAEEVQARLAAIVESSDDAIISKTLDGVVRTWNAGAERLFGYSQQEAVGQPITLIIPPERQDEERAILERLRRGDRVEHFETVRVSKDGRRLDISLTVSPIRDDAGHVIGASKIARDITERKRAENALRESEECYRRVATEAAQAAEANAKFRAFFEQGMNFAGVLALDGTVVEANRLCLDACGFARDEVIGKPFWECGWWNRSAALMKMVRAASDQAAGGRLFRTETNYFVADGAERVVDLILAPVTDEAGRVLFVAATGTDITDRRRMEEALREADRRKDEFLALLAHELRNPLAPLRNGLEVMRLAAHDASAVAQARSMMERQLGHMVRLIDDLLDVSRINRNKMELRRSRVLLADVVSGAVETARPLIDAAGHTLVVSLSPEPVVLDADLTRLAQVFSNLLTNSAKYTERGGHIWLAVERRGEDVFVSVRDDGIGIPAESLPSIFDMFSQVDRSIERSTGGLGIGLALVQGLVEMHGGSVTAESPGVGKGSTFTVRLPALESRPEPVTPEPAEGGPAASGPRRRILVVDDNRDSATSLGRLLKLLGNDVRTAHDGVEATEATDEFRPEVILMDVGMPRLNGYEATRRIREQPWGRAVIIIALTGWGQDGDRLLSREAGCDGHLVKPVNLADLETLLTELTGSRRPQSRSSDDPSGRAWTPSIPTS
jgi:PAS domain S-box-containing protein